MLILAPQCPDEHPLWEVHTIKALLDKIVQEYKVDTSRIYITGMSMGAYGMWEMLIKYPEIFAAAISVCHGGYTNRSYRIKHIPVWLFHGVQDTLVDPGYSIRMAQSLMAAGANKVNLTLYPKADHDAWIPTYSNSQVYKWLLKHSLNKIK
jgi:predicted peptidase